MAVFFPARSALTLATLGALALNAHATDYPDGLLVRSGQAESLVPGDRVSISGAAPARALVLQARSTLDAAGITVTNHTAGDATAHAHGLLAFAGTDTVIERSVITMAGARSVGVNLQGPASIALDDVQVSADADGGIALMNTGGDVVIRGGQLTGNRSAILTGPRPDGMSHVSLSGAARIRGDIVSDGSDLRLVAEDTDLTGDMHRAGDGSFHAVLRRSRWSGRADAVSSLVIEAGSWRITGDSRVGQLLLATGGGAAFAAPGRFATLRVRDVDNPGNDGILHLRTRLDEGGPLVRQATDRLLVSGNASGQTTLHVVNEGGEGGQAEAGAGGGISLVQVAGKATDQSFRLAGDYVAVGPWRYRLHAFGPDESDPAQRLVEGDGAGYWDFRLQGARVSDAVTPRPATELPLTPRMPAAPRLALAPQVPSYLVLTNALFGYGAAAISAMQASDASPVRDTALSVRSFGGHTSYRSDLSVDRYGVDYERSEQGLQLGSDVLAYASGETTMRAGIVATVGTMTFTPHAVDGTSRSRTDARGLAVTYALATGSGWRANGSLGATRYRVGVSTPLRGEVMDRLTANARHMAVSLARQWDASAHLRIEPGLAATWQSLHVNRARDRDGIRLSGAAAHRLDMRGGARATLAFEPRGASITAWAAWLDLGMTRTIASRHAVTVSGVPFATGRAGQAATVAAGVSVDLRTDVTLFTDVSGRYRMGRSGETGASARAGLLWVF